MERLDTSEIGGELTNEITCKILPIFLRMLNGQQSANDELGDFFKEVCGRNQWDFIVTILKPPGKDGMREEITQYSSLPAPVIAKIMEEIVEQITRSIN
jgi:hypothetical protein